MHQFLLNHSHKLTLGFSVSPEELESQIDTYIMSVNVTGWASLGSVISATKNTPELRWANPLDIKKTVDKVFLNRFGAKESAKPKGKVRKLYFDFQ